MDPGDYLKFLLALIFVLSLIGLFAFLVKRFGFGLVAKTGRPGQKRLQIVEVTALDARRRLVLVRRDDKEHLLLLGANNDVVVEKDIAAAVTADQSANRQMAQMSSESKNWLQ